MRALDVRGRGCAGHGLLQRRDDRRQRTHERKAGPAERQISVGLGVSRHRLNNRGRRVGPNYRKAAVITAINRHRLLWANGELPVFSGQPATALQQLKPSMRQKRNGLGLCAATGPCNPRATHTDGPMKKRRLRVQVVLAQTPGSDAGCLVSTGILGFLAASPGVHGCIRAAGHFGLSEAA